ncbi:MAG: AraC family transcriptional regulator [bacterium]|nr:AraC family transcriptional regulator [bacterium]
MDVLTDVLNTLRLKSSVYYRSQISTRDWSLRFNATQGAMFHVIDQGECFLEFAAEGQSGSEALHEGDLVVLPQGSAHVVSQQPHTAPLVSIQLDRDYPVYHHQHYPGDGAMTTLICGLFDFAHHNRYPLIAFMPALLRFTGDQCREAGLDATLRLIREESKRARPGVQTLLNRLSDVLFVQVVRLWLDDPSTQVRGWLGALQDALVGQALALIHSQPGHNWTVASLARGVAMSRSAFAERFTLLVGQSPYQYLIHWRMQTALMLMDENHLPLGEIALRVGYESEAAFHKAFKREMGISPGAYRRSLT